MNPVAGSSRVEIDRTRPLRKLSVVLPVYNEKNTIREIVERVLRSEIPIEKELVIVDEAHHLNVDEETGPTLGYKLVEGLLEESRIGSMVFFTGTPQ